MGRTTGESPESRRRRARIEAILDAAAERFASGGYERTSLGDVAESVDLTPKALYHYYSSKRELLEAVLIREFKYFDPETLAEARTKWTNASLVNALTESSIEALREIFIHGQLLRVSFTESLHGSESIQRRHDVFQRNWIAHVEAIVNGYSDVPPSRRAAFADHLVSLLFGVAVDAILRPRPEVLEGGQGTDPSRAYVRSVVTDLLEGVLTPKRTAARNPRPRKTS